MNANTGLENIDELILSFLRDKITPEEKDYLKNWLSYDKANKEYFREIYMLWKGGSISDFNLQEKRIKEAYQKVNYKIFETEEKNLILPEEKNPYLIILRWAAAIFISIGLGAVLSYMFIQSNLNKGDYITQSEINVPLGSKSKIVLPDLTEVWLNAGSKLTYNRGFGKKLREVNLEGEGYFKVAKMPEKPFIVHTLKANIKALGTEFNVKAYPDENTIETFLVKGSVVVDKITSANINSSVNNQSIVLKPGQKILIYKDIQLKQKQESDIVDLNKKQLLRKSTVPSRLPALKEMRLQNSNAEVETSWKDHSWVIQGENVKELFTKLGRRFNVSIFLLDKELDKYKFSGIIESETLEQVFDYMSLTIPMSYSIDKGKVAISLNQKLESKYKRAYNN